MNTWDRNPQPAEDAFEAEQWFADPKLYRDTRWNIHAEGLDFLATPEVIRSHG